MPTWVSRDLSRVGRPVGLTLALAVGLAQIAVGQAPASPTRSAFEAASVKTSAPGRIGGSWAGRGSQLVIDNYRLRDIILGAFQLRTFQLVGGPEWINSTRFDIVGRAPDAVPRDITMLQRLLAERFRLQTHTETRQLPVFALVLAREDGRLGPELRRSTLDCAVMRCSASVVAGKIGINGYTMADVARTLTSFTERMVIDRTGLAGVYDLSLTWTPDNGPADAAVDPNAPALSTAVTEQLGLKLESTLGPVEVHVIDSVEAPTPD